jgi:CelD/BcsL family acetyltransferase involved in cellulose biosynthesis
MIDLPETHVEYWSKFNSKTRSTLRRKLKQFGECRLELIKKPFQIPDFLANAQQVSKRSWQSDLLGLRIQNDEYETQVFTFLATQNSLRAYLLWQDDTPVSFCIGTQHNGVFHYEEVGYDRDYSKKSPGQVLVIKMLEELYEHDQPAVFDFGGGDAEYKRQFGTRISESGHVWLLRPGMRSKMIVGYLSGRRALSQTLRGMLAKFGLLDRVRKLTRRGLNS